MESRCAESTNHEPIWLVLKRLPVAGFEAPNDSHDRLDLGQFPHLMPQGIGIAAGELLAAASAFRRFGRLHVVAVLRGDQRPLMFLVPRLTATFLLRRTLGQGRFGMGMDAAGRQRGILGCFPPLLELGYPIQQRHHESPNGRSHLGVKLGRNRDRLVRGRHDVCRPRKSRSCPDQFVQKTPPGA
jgi:hypothetical protein